jgi:hypothetical protein
VRAGRRLGGLATALTVATFAVPAVASATPQFSINGLRDDSFHQNVVALGTLTMDNKLFGEWKCRGIADLHVWNETEKGLAQVETWKPFGCSSKECPSGFVTTEYAPELIEKVNSKGETEYSARRSITSSFPWPAETLTGVGAQLKIRKMRLQFVCPAEEFEPVFTGNLEPRIVNGLGNGMSPTHLLFEGPLGHTTWLNGTWEGGEETEETPLFVSGELAVIGGGMQLITAE